MVSDDQLSLASFSLTSTESIQFLKLLPGHLPENYIERKKLKPDWESLVCLRSKNGIDEVLILPSGSKANRTVGVLANIFNEELQSAKEIDFSALYAKLEETFSDLNIEGVAVTGSMLKIFQRGNGKSRRNAVIDLDLNGVIADIEGTGIIAAKHIQKISDYNLGMIDGVPLTFTDACFCNDQLFFIAAAEAGNSTYNDGKYLGAVFGCINNSGKITFQKRLLCDFKPEGLWVEFKFDHYIIYIVTDADSLDITSSFFVTEIKPD